MKQFKLIAVSIIITIFALSAQLSWSAPDDSGSRASPPPPKAAPKAPPAPKQASPQEQFDDCENDAKNAIAKKACICNLKPNSPICRKAKADELYDSCMSKSKTKKGKLDCKYIDDCYRHPDTPKCQVS